MMCKREQYLPRRMLCGNSAALGEGRAAQMARLLTQHDNTIACIVTCSDTYSARLNA